MEFQELDSITLKKENKLKLMGLGTVPTEVTHRNGQKPTKPTQGWNEHDEEY